VSCCFPPDSRNSSVGWRCARWSLSRRRAVPVTAAQETPPLAERRLSTRASARTVAVGTSPDRRRVAATGKSASRILLRRPVPAVAARRFRPRLNPLRIAARRPRSPGRCCLPASLFVRHRQPARGRKSLRFRPCLARLSTAASHSASSHSDESASLGILRADHAPVARLRWLDR